jgi:hypothetical protein
MPKKHYKTGRNAEVIRIDVLKDYIYISSVDELFRSAVDGMYLVEEIDRGYPWPDDVHEMHICDDEDYNIRVYETCEISVELNQAIIEEERKIKVFEESMRKIKRLRLEQRRKVAKVIRKCIKEDYNKYFYMPNYTTGRTVMSFLTIMNLTEIQNERLMLGIIALSLSVSFCLKSFYIV